MKAELITEFQFEASHSLSGYEEPHSHLWRLQLVLAGEVVQGKIVDLVDLRAQVEAILLDLRGTYLNENPKVLESVRQAPTCETLCEYFGQKMDQLIQAHWSLVNPSVGLGSVCVTLCDLEGNELGGVRTRAGGF
ncbi:MAG: 6-pyruvoyl trahydropterin synthase family protein [Bdellovibrionia bacterium]